jgi:hypothetical protein
MVAPMSQIWGLVHSPRIEPFFAIGIHYRRSVIEFGHIQVDSIREKCVITACDGESGEFSAIDFPFLVP